MKIPFIKSWALLALLTAFIASALPASAQQERQGRGNFDPAQMRERMMERMREQFDVKSDDEWKIIESRLSKVIDAQRDARMGIGFGGGMRGPGGPGGRRGSDNNANENQQRRNPFGGDPVPEAEALQKAIESKASAEEIKTRLAKFRDARKTREAALEKAQDDLRKVLSARQEAEAVVMGMLR